MTDQTAPDPGFGIAATATGAAALLGVAVTVCGGPFAPQPDAAVSLGEFAAQAGKAALRDVLGAPQPPEVARAWDIDRVLWVAMALLGALAIVLGAVAAIRREPWRWALGGAALGAGAIVFRYAMAVVATVLALMLIGMVLGALGG